LVQAKAGLGIPGQVFKVRACIVPAGGMNKPAICQQVFSKKKTVLSSGAGDDGYSALRIG
jgi:hypothetical protein